MSDTEYTALSNTPLAALHLLHRPQLLRYLQGKPRHTRHSILKALRNH